MTTDDHGLPSMMTLDDPCTHGWSVPTLTWMRSHRAFTPCVHTVRSHRAFSSAVLAAINAREKAVRQRQRAVVSEARAEAKVRATALDGP
jgi:hypothetical protein